MTDESRDGFKAMKPDERKLDIGQRAAEARRLGKCADALMKAGKTSEALVATKEAIVFWRGIVTDDPSQLPELARSLGYLCIWATRLGDAAESLQAAVECVRHWRVLSDQDTGRYGVHLVSALTHLGPRLHIVHPKNAFSSREEATELALRLLDMYGERHLLLAATLCLQMAETGSRYGFPAKARAYAEKSVMLWRRLADQDLIRHGQGLVRALKRLSAEQLTPSGFAKGPLREARRVKLTRLFLRLWLAILPPPRG